MGAAISAGAAVLNIFQAGLISYAQKHYHVSGVPRVVLQSGMRFCDH